MAGPYTAGAAPRWAWGCCEDGVDPASPTIGGCPVGKGRQRLTLRTDQEDDRGVIDGVIVVLGNRMLLVIDAILFGQRRDLRRRAGQPDNAGLKRACELLQDSGCIALRVQRDEERLYLLASLSELIERFSDRVECRGTRSGAMRG